MIGSFLEVSIETGEILESIEFYERLGFEQTTVGEVWKHPYAVLTDGEAFVGLHQYHFDSPAVTFVRPELAAVLRTLRRHGVDFEFTKIGDEEFNEAGFFAPGEQMIALLEARTFSPLAVDAAGTICGRFEAYGMAVRSLEDAISFWQGLGFTVTDESDEPRSNATVRGAGVTLQLHEKPARHFPRLQFSTQDLKACRSKLQTAGVEVRFRYEELQFESPEGLAFAIRER